MAYTKTVDFAAKDALLTGNPSKLILGTEIDTEFNNIATADALNYKSSGTDVAVTDGGTGRSTGTTAYALVATGTTATGAQQTLASGATTEILKGGGASALPVWTTVTGTGAPVCATSPTLVTPALGTPTSGVLTNCTASFAGAVSGTTGTFSGNVSAAALLTGSGVLNMADSDWGTYYRPDVTGSQYGGKAEHTFLNSLSTLVLGHIDSDGNYGALGGVSGTTGTFSGAVSGTTGTFSGAVSGTTITGSAAGMPKFSAYLLNGGANQSITTTTYTKVQLDTEDFDTATAFASTTNYRFTPATAGYYLLSWAALLGAASNTITTGRSHLYKNGSSEKTGSSVNGATLTTLISTGSAVVYFNGSTDYVELYVFIVGTSPYIGYGATNTYLTGTLLA